MWVGRILSGEQSLWSQEQTETWGGVGGGSEQSL